MSRRIDDNTAVDELLAWIDDIAAREFWAELAPGLSVVADAAAASALVDVDEALLLELRNAMLIEGYYQFDPLLPATTLTAMRDCVTTLHERRIPLGFAFVYDEFWRLGVWLGEVLAAMLGRDFVQLPDMWAWFVEPGTSGWDPHREKGAESLLDNGFPKSLSTWVPLSDATPLNGCMYIVPADRDPDYPGANDAIDVHRLQDVRALPARAGSVLMWNQALLHWGAGSSPRAPEPRISFSIEYQRGDVDAFNTPLLDPSQPPTFERRLGLVGKQLVQYEHMLGAHPRLLELGQRLQDRFPVSPHE